MELKEVIKLLSVDELYELSTLIHNRIDEIMVTKPLDANQIDLIESGDNIEAIKDYRAMHHSSLREAHVAIRRHSKLIGPK